MAWCCSTPIPMSAAEEGWLEGRWWEPPDAGTTYMFRHVSVIHVFMYQSYTCLVGCIWAGQTGEIQRTFVWLLVSVSGGLRDGVWLSVCLCSPTLWDAASRCELGYGETGFISVSREQALASLFGAARLHCETNQNQTCWYVPGGEKFSIANTNASTVGLGPILALMHGFLPWLGCHSRLDHRYKSWARYGY
jgi:hypothetical protein